MVSIWDEKEGNKVAEKNLKGKVMSGLAWVFGERILAQLVSTVVTIVLARQLTPEHYGTISIVTVFITFFNVFVTSGFGSALVQKKDANNLDFDTAFGLSFGMSWILYALLFFVAPAIAVFYEMPQLIPVLRVMGLRLPLASINTVQRAYVQRAMNFKKFFLVTVGGTAVSGVIGVAMAYAGFGVWALVAQYMSNTVFSTMFLFAVCTWRPKIRFSTASAKNIWGFGWKVLATQLVATLQNDIRSLIVGKIFCPADLAYYDQGRKYPALLMTNISSSIDSVMLAAYSKEQEDRQRMLSMLRRSIRTGVYILVPILLGFAAVSESFVKLLLTEKWLPAVPFMQVFAISFVTRPLESSSRQALLAIGKGEAVLVVSTAINVVALLGTLIAVFMFESVFAIALVTLATTLVSVVCYMSYSRYYLQYHFKMQLHDILPSILIGMVMYATVQLIGLIQLNVWMILMAQILAGVAVYVGCSLIFKLESFRYLIRMVQGKRRHLQQ